MEENKPLHWENDSERKLNINTNKEARNIVSKPKEKNYNKTAITGLILSIISIFGLGLVGLIGFILGIVALTQIKHTKERGKGLAIAAIIIGVIWSFGTGILKQLI